MCLLSKYMLIPLFICFTAIIVPEIALCNGGKGKIYYYVGETYIDGDSGGVCSFSTQFEKVLFRLNSVQNKYKAVRIRIVNYSKSPLLLSAERDKIELIYDQRGIPGILNIANHDPAFWDSLDLEMRKALVYPKKVEAGEEENIFVFLPDSNLTELPIKFLYVIDSLPEKRIFIYEFSGSKQE